jgi:hypothetical protein
MGINIFDSRCYDVAQLFCDDAGVVDPQSVNELAAAIQETIEDFLAMKQPDV